MVPFLAEPLAGLPVWLTFAQAQLEPITAHRRGFRTPSLPKRTDTRGTTVLKNLVSFQIIKKHILPNKKINKMKKND